MVVLKVENAHGRYWLLLLIVLSLLLSACTEQVQQKPKVPEKNANTKLPQTTVTEEEWKLPITVPEGEFYKSAGWLSDHEIIYITNLGQTSSLYRYHLITGKSELIYKSNDAIVNVEISPSKKYLLIHSSPTTYEGIITVINTDGSVQASEKIPSYELLYEWNPYNDSEILISKFNEDWSFEVLLLDIKRSDLTEVSLPQPFVKWTGNDTFAYLNWDDNNPALYAPLLERDLGSNEEKSLFPVLYQFSTYQNVLLAITANATENPQANYSFYDQDMNEIFSFTSPLLSKYSDWLIPFYDYNVMKNQFAALKPIRSGEADAYMDGFDLEIYNLKKRERKVIMSGLENEPIQFSPSGNALLYGNSYEKIINLSKKQIIELMMKE
jgi:hypothetical protein